MVAASAFLILIGRGDESRSTASNCLLESVVVVVDVRTLEEESSVADRRRQIDLILTDRCM